MYFYFAYGLSIGSELPLPELIPAELTPDVLIHSKPYGAISSLNPPDDYSIGVFRDSIIFWWDETGIILIHDGQEVTIEQAAGTDERFLQWTLANEVMAALLHQRGKLVLHGSAAVIDGGVVIFIGRSGQGKSTTVAALQSHGYSAIADDVVAIDVDLVTGAAQVWPAFPQVKLWPEAASALGHDLETMPYVTPSTQKRFYRHSEDFPVNPLPLRAIYVLDKDEQTSIERLSPQSACFELLTHSYLNHMSNSYEFDLLTATGTMATNFQRCAKLANSVPIKRLKRRFALSDLGELVKLIEQDAAAHS